LGSAPWLSGLIPYHYSGGGWGRSAEFGTHRQALLVVGQFDGDNCACLGQD
jgi:hypothetical protein